MRIFFDILATGPWGLLFVTTIDCAELRLFWKINHFRLAITTAVAITTDIDTFAVFFLRQASATNITPQYL